MDVLEGRALLSRTPLLTDLGVPHRADPGVHVEKLSHSVHPRNGGGLSERQLMAMAHRQGAAPVLRITSPLADNLIATGEGRPGAGSVNGTGFTVNLEAVTRDNVPVRVREATVSPTTPGIRHVDQLGRQNPDFPGLYVFFSTDLINPDGKVIPRGTNLASLFNIAGSDDTPGPGVTVWAGWHVLESLPVGVKSFTITAAVVDERGRVGLDRETVHVDRAAASGQALTPPPSTTLTPPGADDSNGPDVTLIAPRAPTSVARGALGTPTFSSGTLHFIQVSALDRSGAGIGVSENGQLASPAQAAGLIFDPTQIKARGPNRNFPGLSLTFDVPLRQPNGVLVPAGVNLAPLFDIVGSEVDLGTGRVRTTASWVVGGSLELPPGKTSVTITARVTDNAGHTSTSRQFVGISSVSSGQDLTPEPLPIRTPRGPMRHRG